MDRCGIKVHIRIKQILGYCDTSEYELHTVDPVETGSKVSSCNVKQGK